MQNILARSKQRRKLTPQEKMVKKAADQKKLIDKYLFGGNREIAIQRDKEKCVKCGMTREQHKNKYKRDITVDHIDGNGSSVAKDKKNNNLRNLQTLCLACMGCYESRTAIAEAISAERNANLDKIRELNAENFKMMRTYNDGFKEYESKIARQQERILELEDIVKESTEIAKRNVEKVIELESKLADAEKENKRLIEFIELGSEFHE